MSFRRFGTFSPIRPPVMTFQMKTEPKRLINLPHLLPWYHLRLYSVIKLTQSNDCGKIRGTKSERHIALIKQKQLFIRKCFSFHKSSFFSSPYFFRWLWILTWTDSDSCPTWKRPSCHQHLSNSHQFLPLKVNRAAESARWTRTIWRWVWLLVLQTIRPNTTQCVDWLSHRLLFFFSNVWRHFFAETIVVFANDFTRRWGPTIGWWQ